MSLTKEDLKIIAIGTLSMFLAEIIIGIFELNLFIVHTTLTISLWLLIKTFWQIKK